MARKKSRNGQSLRLPQLASVSNTYCISPIYFELAGGPTNGAYLFRKSFQYFEFGLVSWLHHEVVFLCSPFPKSRFQAAWAIANLMDRDRLDHLFVKCRAIGFTATARGSDQGLRCFKSLDRRFEANLPGKHP